MKRQLITRLCPCLNTWSPTVCRYAIGHSHSVPPPGAPLQMRPVAVLPTDNFAVSGDEQWHAYSRRASLPTRVGTVTRLTWHSAAASGVHHCIC